MSLDEALRRVARIFETREETFLDLMERAVFGYARSPYLPLLEAAGCELGDVRDLVSSVGIEATLRRLRGAGVYVSFEEFKGRCPIVRDGLTVEPDPADFDNPLERDVLRSTTGGSTGRPAIVRYSLRDVEEKVPTRLLGYWAHDVLGAPTAGINESSSSKRVLVDSRCGQTHERWFAPRIDRTLAAAMGFRIQPAVVSALCRLGGTRLPVPRAFGLDEAHVVAEWAGRRAREAGRVLVRANPSHSLRVATAALERGIDLTGVTFMGAGDPVTLGKARGIARSGARFVPLYTATETGRVGMGCVHPSDPSDVHLLNHYIALITHPRQVPGSPHEVASFHFTSLRLGAPKILLNVELDDYGVLEERSCGCPFEQLGFRSHLRDIYSYRKLTGEGVTLVGSTMLRVLDEVLPARFGGTTLDYQLVEEEDERGFTRMTLVVSPSVHASDAALEDAVLDALDEDPVAIGARSIWRQTGALRVERRTPEVTMRGKIVPLASERRRDR